MSVEGIVFILNSTAKTLRDLVRTSLWSTAAQDRVRGQLPSISSQPADLDSWREFQELQSQIMGWLGDGNSYLDSQADVFSEMCFSYQSGSKMDKAIVKSVVSEALTALESGGYAIAASPFQLTERGQAARLAGLSPASIRRLEHSIARGREGWLTDLVGVTELTGDMSRQIANILFDAVEVFEHSLWSRRLAGSTEQAKLHSLLGFAANSLTYQDTEEFQADLELVSNWILGASYAELGGVAPLYKHAGSLFGGDVESKRTSDATEYIGKLSYPSRWAWSAVQVLADDLGRSLPGFIGPAIELGLPSEAATRLCTIGYLTRPGALAVTAQLGSSWAEVKDIVVNEDITDTMSGLLTTLDLDRLGALRERLALDADG